MQLFGSYLGTLGCHRFYGDDGLSVDVKGFLSHEIPDKTTLQHIQEISTLTAEAYKTFTFSKNKV